MHRSLPAETKRACVEKILESVAFARAAQLRRLFLWLAERSIDGGPVPTEHEVGRGALGRPENWDPQTDSLVRKEMSRLRAKLRVYAAGEGRADAVRVRHDDGYRLSFVGPPAGALPSPNPDSPLCFLVLPLVTSPPTQPFADTFYDELLWRLAALDRLTLVSPTTARMYATRLGDVRDFATETGADYVIEGSARPVGNTTQILLWLAAGPSGHTRLLARLSGSDPEALSAAAAEHLRDQLFPPSSTEEPPAPPLRRQTASG